MMAAKLKKPRRLPRGARAATQKRSRETLEQILVAAEHLLETREFDELGMIDLAKHANCGVGTVYGRVPNKESLLLCLHERYMESGLASSAEVFAQCRNAVLDVRVRALCAMIIDFLAANRGVTRAITSYLFVRPSGEIRANVSAFRRSTTAGFKQAAAFLAKKVDRSVHPDPQDACEFGLLAATDVAQSRVVFGDRSGLRINYSTRVLKSRISALLLAYLQHG